MGRIHDALQRAEEERSRLGAAPGGPKAAREIVERSAELARPVTREPRLTKRNERKEQVRSKRRSRVVIDGVDSMVTEEYRTLRARIQSIRRSRSIRSLAITSALANEGKTTTAINLAMSFGLEREHRTCLVDADLRVHFHQ